MNYKLSDDGTTLLEVDEYITTFEIPNGVTTVGACVFQFCNDLKNITIPDSVTTIRDYAFDDCRKLTSIKLPNVTTIGRLAFFHCRNLHTIIIPNIKNIEPECFYGCNKLTYIIGNISSEQLKIAFGDEDHYKEYTYRCRDYKLIQLIG